MSLSTDQLAVVSRLFSSGVFRQLARKGQSPLFARLVGQSSLMDSVSSNAEVQDLFDSAFSLLKKEGNRDEYVYNAAITEKILLGRHSLQTASMLSEFRVGDSKADIVILNGTAAVYEVKSERDYLSRLEKQIAAYRRVFASVNVIAGESHVGAVMDMVPESVGVLKLSRRHQISAIREAAHRPEQTLPEAIFDSIRTIEAQQVLQMNGIQLPKVPNTELHSLLRKHFVQLDPIVAHEGMVEVLKRTRNLMPLSELINELPASLHTAALSMPLRKVDHARLIAAVNTPLRDALAWV